VGLGVNYLKNTLKYQFPEARTLFSTPASSPRSTCSNASLCNPVPLSLQQFIVMVATSGMHLETWQQLHC
jgi:hypothetical protein